MPTAVDYRMLDSDIKCNYTIFSVLETVLNCHSNETAKHTKRTAEYARVIIEKMLCYRQYERELIENDYPSIIRAIPLHDIGKVGIRDNILYKPGALTNTERIEIQNHITIGLNIVNSMRRDKSMSETAFNNCRDVVQFHHERWDGMGYLKGLRKENIPLSARITAIVDVYDAVTSPRCYKEKYAHSEAVEIIKQGRGTHFDPGIVDCFLEVAGQFHLICINLSDDNPFDKLMEYTVTQSNEPKSHLKRISNITKALTDVMATNHVFRDESNQFNSIVEQSVFHDIGYAKIIDSIKNSDVLKLHKFEQFKRHTIEGSHIIEKFAKNNNVILTQAYEMALYHHEWWNGGGYPFGIKGKDIPLSARILAPVIVYEMLSTKIFKDEESSRDLALSFIYNQRGIQFDPIIIDCFLLAGNHIWINNLSNS